ncbi:MAG: M23 family metallopeptidase [Ardenticatenales bacterium]
MSLTPLPQSGKLAGGEPDPSHRRRFRRRVGLLAAVGVVGVVGWQASTAHPLVSMPAIRTMVGSFGETATATPTRPPASPTPQATATATATPFVPAPGLIDPPPPFLRFGRPFDPPDLAIPERSYLYGTNAEGTLLLHHGDDLGAPSGSDVRAIGDGTVVYAGLDTKRLFGPMADFYGRLVVIGHADGGADASAGATLYSLYGHLSSTSVGAGRRVRRGDVIGKVGMAGIALGPHLHLEIRVDPFDYEATRNPLLYIAPVSGTGVVVARVLDAVGRPLDKAMVGLFALDGGERWVAQARTYPADHVHPSEPWGENVAFNDLPPGRYALQTIHHSQTVRTEFMIAADRATYAVLAP